MLEILCKVEALIANHAKTGQLLRRLYESLLLEWSGDEAKRKALNMKREGKEWGLKAMMKTLRKNLESRVQRGTLQETGLL